MLALLLQIATVTTPPPEVTPINPVAVSPTTPPTLPSVPGVINPKVTQANIRRTVCSVSWMAQIRPSASYTTHLKLQQMAKLGLHGVASDFEEDHLISLELGGAPRDSNNLWPQPWLGMWNAHDKDRLENALHRQVCAGTRKLADAQTAIRTNWITAYQTQFPTAPVK